MAPWLHNLASILTIASFPVTLLSLNATFDLAPVEVALPEMPFGAAIAVVAFLLASAVFAVAFAGWYRVLDIRLGWDRLVVVPVLGFVSAAQSFAVMEILVGPFDTSGRGIVYGLGLAAALAIETRYLVRHAHRDLGALVAANCAAYAFFAMVIGFEADPSPARDADVILPFLTSLAFGGAMFTVAVWVLEEAKAR
jgi:hypothetical protein